MDNFENTSVEETTATTTEQNDDSAKTYTQEEVAKMLQQESDRRVTAALAKQKREFDKKLSLSKLDDNEREKAEQANTIAELREQLAAFQIEKNRSELKSVLSSRGLSAEFADIIAINDDIEASQRNIDALDKLFKAAVRAEVEKRIAGGVPKAGGNTNPAAMTKERLTKMSMRELQEFKRNYPEEYARCYSN